MDVEGCWEVCADYDLHWSLFSISVVTVNIANMTQMDLSCLPEEDCGRFVMVLRSEDVIIGLFNVGHVHVDRIGLCGSIVDTFHSREFIPVCSALVVI